MVAGGVGEQREGPAPAATRARIVLWHEERRPKEEVADLVGYGGPS